MLFRKARPQLVSQHVIRYALAREVIERPLKNFVVAPLAQRTQVTAAQIFYHDGEIFLEVFAVFNLRRFEQHDRLNVQLIVAENLQAVLAQHQRRQNSVGLRGGAERHYLL